MPVERLQKILAQAGYGSRRFCETLIIDGRIKVNGVKAILGQKADLSVDEVLADGQKVRVNKEMVYLMYNKPRFVLCDKTVGDSRRTIFDMVEGASNLAVVGRLDFESEGLVILTNNGELVNKLTHPRYEHEKEYRVLVSTIPDAKQLQIWGRGVVLEDGHKTLPAKVEIESKLGKGSWMRVVLKEGHKRQIREMAKVTGLFIIRLVRIRIGSLKLGSLKSGEFRSLNDRELDQLMTLTH
jgi:23S rRNA pseudouridine2605 synthase